MNYNYREAIWNDIYDYIDCNIGVSDWSDRDTSDIYEELEEKLWIEDSVTGNGSGSYTFSRSLAKEYVSDNMGLCMDALEEFGVEYPTIGKHFHEEDWEYFDVIIRCYLLGKVLWEVIESYK